MGFHPTITERELPNTQILSLPYHLGGVPGNRFVTGHLKSPPPPHSD